MESLYVWFTEKSMYYLVKMYWWLLILYFSLSLEWMFLKWCLIKIGIASPVMILYFSLSLEWIFLKWCVIKICIAFPLMILIDYCTFSLFLEWIFCSIILILTKFLLQLQPLIGGSFIAQPISLVMRKTRDILDVESKCYQIGISIKRTFLFT